MPLTTLDPTPALVVIDLQGFVRSLSTVHPIDHIVARTAQLARAFRQHDFPVVLVNVAGLAPGRTDAGRINLQLPEGWTALLPELGQHPGDYLVTKQRFGAFIGTSLDSYLRQRGVTQIFLTGVATSLGVESTARSAYDHGYHVVLVVDAMTDRDDESHRHTTEKIFPRLGETATTESVCELLAKPQI